MEKEESRGQIKPREEGGKKGLEEYENDVTDENHSQDRASSSTQQSTASLQKKMVYPCEGHPPEADEDDGAKLEEEEAKWDEEKAKLEVKLEEEKAKRDEEKAKLKAKWVEEKAKLEAKLEEEKAKWDEETAKWDEEKAKLEAKLEEEKGQRSACLECGTWEWNSKFDTKNSNQELQILPRLNDEDDGAKCKEENAILMKQVKCLEGFVMPYEVMLRELLSEFHRSDRGIAINKNLWKLARQKHPEFRNMLQIQFSKAIAALVTDEGNEDTENKLKILQVIAESWVPPQRLIPGLVWDKQTGKGYFACCKAVAFLNKKLHPNVKGDKANHQIREMANKGFIYDGVDIGKFAARLWNL